MEQFINFIEGEARKADSRYKSICLELESGLEAVGGIDVMAAQVMEAQKEKARHHFFSTLRARYEADSAQGDMPAFITFCLDVIAGEFTENVKVEALTEARKLLLKQLTPVLAQTMN